MQLARIVPKNESFIVGFESVRFLQGELERATGVFLIVGFQMIDGSRPWQGELEEAMSVALSAADMAAESLGEKHFKAKAVRKV